MNMIKKNKNAKKNRQESMSYMKDAMTSNFMQSAFRPILSKKSLLSSSAVMRAPNILFESPFNSNDDILNGKSKRMQIKRRQGNGSVNFNDKAIATPHNNNPKSSEYSNNVEPDILVESENREDKVRYNEETGRRRVRYLRNPERKNSKLEKQENSLANRIKMEGLQNFGGVDVFEKEVLLQQYESYLPSMMKTSHLDPTDYTVEKHSSMNHDDEAYPHIKVQKAQIDTSTKNIYKRSILDDDYEYEIEDDVVGFLYLLSMDEAHSKQRINTLFSYVIYSLPTIEGVMDLVNEWSVRALGYQQPP